MSVDRQYAGLTLMFLIIPKQYVFNTLATNNLQNKP